AFDIVSGSVFQETEGGGRRSGSRGGCGAGFGAHRRQLACTNDRTESMAHLRARGSPAMKRQVTVKGRAGRIEIQGSRLRYVRDDGIEVEREFSIRDGSVLLNGRSYRVSLGTGKD